jgi:predicted AlkP superfamily pyrophosphatase or phosphodiesterase
MTWDQLRADMMTRYSNQFLPAYSSTGDVGGFRWLMENGAVMADTHYNHLPLHTGPGHATVLTGAAPRRTGIVGNSWYTSAGLTMNCVGDPDVKTVGAGDSRIKNGSSSPRNLLAETVGDELKLANNRQSKVIGMAIKDRGAILPSGHDADAAVWFDSSHGNWITSTWYTTSTLPRFAQRANDSRLADRWVNENWDLLLPEEAYKISMPVDAPGIAPGRPIGFPKVMSEKGKANKDYYGMLTLSPFANEMVFETAKMAVEFEDMGQDLYPDILALSFSTTDAIGHAYGPHSREIQDCVIRADRQLSNFLNYLNGAVPGGLDNVLIVLTADHGGAALPEWLQTRKFPAKRVLYEDIIKTAENALAEQWPDKQTTGVVLFSDPYIRFRIPVMNKRGINVDKAAEVIANKLKDLDGITETFTRKQIESGNLPRTREAQAATNGFNHERSGEVVLLNDQFCYNSRYPSGSTHGTSYNYDNHVPLIIAGSKIKPGAYTDRADVRDIAPTLSFLLGITAPASSEGRILTDIIR